MRLGLSLGLSLVLGFGLGLGFRFVQDGRHARAAKQMQTVESHLVIAFFLGKVDCRCWAC